MEVESTQGFWFQTTTKVSGFQYYTAQFNIVDRIPTVEYYPLRDGQRATTPKRFEYAYIIFQLTNQTTKITRKYQSYIDVAQNVGGVCEIIIFLFVFLVLYHHELILELYLHSQLLK